VWQLTRNLSIARDGSGDDGSPVIGQSDNGEYYGGDGASKQWSLGLDRGGKERKRSNFRVGRPLEKDT